MTVAGEVLLAAGSWTNGIVWLATNGAVLLALGIDKGAVLFAGKPEYELGAVVEIGLWY